MKTDKKVTPEYAKQAKTDWKASGTAADIKVLGENLTYVPLDMKPADLQFLETQKFDTTQIARLLGIPASIMLAAVDGSNLTYSNIEQSWIEFADYTLAAYAGEIEELFNRLLPRGRTAAFDWDSSRRADMADRFNAYQTAIASGWMTVDEIRRARPCRHWIRQQQPKGATMKREIGFRGVCLRSADDGDGRTLEGVAVPYGQIIDTWDGAETFDLTAASTTSNPRSCATSTAN